MTSLQTYIEEERDIVYDGLQLAPHWIYKTFERFGSTIVGFKGPAQVDIENMVDLEDVNKKAPIYSPLMLHFVGEWFEDSLDKGVLYQHLFVSEIYELLLEKGIQNLNRRGNDLFYQGRKLSVSIATKSPVSLLMHTGLNIETEGTPIPTSGLKELDIPPLQFAKEILTRFQRDYNGWQKARAKVLPR